MQWTAAGAPSLDGGFCASLYHGAINALVTRWEVAVAVSLGEVLPFSSANQVLTLDSVVIGESPSMRRLARRVRRAEKHHDSIWIDGEAGSGKDTVARWIHARSSFAQGPFVKVHCPAIPPMLLESELFGRGSNVFLTGWQKTSRIEAAQGGTLYLDEVGALDPSLQERLLVLLRNRQGRPGRGLGAAPEMRLIFSTRRHTAESGEEESAPLAFIQEFKPVHIALPPLKERLADIPALTRYMVEEWGRRYRVPTKALSKEIINLMQASSWRGNLRQLENVLRRYVVLGCDEEAISAELLEQTDLDRLTVFASAGTLPLKQVVAERVRVQERNIILRALHDHAWDCKKTAQALGIGYQSLLQKMRRSEIRPAGVVTARGTGAHSEFVN